MNFEEIRLETQPIDLDAIAQASMYNFNFAVVVEKNSEKVVWSVMWDNQRD